MKDFRLMTILAALTTFLPSYAQNTKDTTILIKEAVVMASKNLARSGSSSISIPANMIKSTPSLLGEADLLKTIQLLPGVQAGTEGQSGMYVRGGGADENLILLDGVPVHCQGHILGLFSPFQSEAVHEAVIHKGAFPARFGGRASSVLEISTQGEVLEKTTGCLGVGSLSDKFHLEGPLASGRLSYSVSGRGMHTFLMNGLMRALKLPANYWFKDLHAKAIGRIDSNNSLTLSYFNSKDNLYYKEDEEKTDISWGTSLGAVKWKRSWSESTTSEVTAALSGYSLNTGLKTPGESREGYKTGLQDIVFKTDWLMTSLPNHNLRFGTEVIRHMFTPESDFGETDQVKTSIKGIESAVYCEDDIKFQDWITVSAGFRMGAYISSGSSRFSPEPRVSVTVGSDSGPQVKAGYSRVAQQIHQLSSTVAVLPVDMILPVTKAIGPVVSNQFSLGVWYRKADIWEFSLEGYWKTMSGVLEYRDGVIFIDDFSTWEEQVAAGIGRSYGLEALLKKNYGNTYGWIGYTLAKSERRFPGGSISSGEWFPARYDIRHSVTIALNHRFGHGWDAGAVWTYSSGGAVTLPESDGSMPHRGNLRLPPSHRLDLGLNHHKAKRHGERIWNIGIYNAYNRKNPNLVIPVTGDGEDGSGSIRKISFLPIIPSGSYTRVF